MSLLAGFLPRLLNLFSADLNANDILLVKNKIIPIMVIALTG